MVSRIPMRFILIGTTSGNVYAFNIWCQKRLTRSGLLGIFSYYSTSYDWISGLAFGKNLWNNDIQNARGFNYNFNTPNGFNSGIAACGVQYDQFCQFAAM